jgi:hypothetical protein
MFVSNPNFWGPNKPELWVPSEGRRETYQSPLISASGFLKGLDSKELY